MYSLNSNTTLVKVKLKGKTLSEGIEINSNTTLVKVKYNEVERSKKHDVIQIQLLLKLNKKLLLLVYISRAFKYNSC